MISLNIQQRPLQLIESDEYPFEFISVVAQRESWRKEIHRPIYHVHKWWANRLGSIFRGIILGCILPEHSDLEHEFYQKQDFSGLAILDPFMGSGTTIGEAYKLGCTALGRDINPIACENVRVALGSLDRANLIREFHALSDTIGTRIKSLYKSADESGQICDALYYFWVKNVPCPLCNTSVDLFPSYIIARNACPDRKPEIQTYCPQCGRIFPALNGDKIAHCPSCNTSFDPNCGPAKRTQAICQTCSTSFRIVDVMRKLRHPPAHRLYAKLILTPDGRKRYLAATSEDIQKYDDCSAKLEQELREGNIILPDASLADGYNTHQAISYNYVKWRDFFNQRQLLALGWLHKAITQITDVSCREAFLTLFSGVLEFNNMFTSYKGEGTGAVRHMFSHHILKPERTPIEANIWGTEKSSGSFSTLFKSRLLRVINYRSDPYELSGNGSRKVHFINAPFSGHIEDDWPTNGSLIPHAIYLSCGTSDDCLLPDKSVDFVITDPPFFDNVHYSELADFFNAWQSLHPRGFITGTPTTRNKCEVQDTNPRNFATKLASVFRECSRVMKDDAILAFTYHHSRNEGWTSLLEALIEAGLSVINAHPVKAEMSVATPKSQAKEPIQLDIVFVCKKNYDDTRHTCQPSQALDQALLRAYDKVARLEAIGLDLSLNDHRVVIISQFITALGPIESPDIAVRALLSQRTRINQIATTNSSLVSSSAESKLRGPNNSLETDHQGRSSLRPIQLSMAGLVNKD